MAWYLGFCKEHKIPDPCGKEHRYLSLIALYAKALINGLNIQHRTIRAAMVRLYLEAVNELFRKRNMKPPVVFQDSTNITEFVANKLEQWESMPKRREPISLEMTEYLSQSSKDEEEDSFEAAIWDWFVLARYLNMCISQYDHATVHMIEWVITRHRQVNSS